MGKNKILICIFFMFTVMGHAIEKKSVAAYRTNETIKIDGYLSEYSYQNADAATDFVQIQPRNGQASFQKSEVKILFDNSSVYVGAMLYDEYPDSIFNYLSERDHIQMSDYFGVYFDPYNEGLTAYGFFITPAGVQIDMKAIKKQHDNEDDSWDAVWESETRIAENGWVVEMRIPYSALRFPQKEVHTWGLNFFRQIRRYNSNNSWQLIDTRVNGFIQQQGVLKGIKGIKPPLRLSLSPYVSTYLEHESNQGTKPVIKGGMDLKYGISESFTLDMMLIPDFGQVQSDDRRLNLSPYELYFDERRQFFTEGMELFERADIFYSRRIGGEPKFKNRVEEELSENETVAYNPIQADIVNASKVSGRTKNGYGFGFLNGMTLPAYAEITDTITGNKRKILTQPFTNYNVSVIEKALKNNSYFSIINTNMSMWDNPWTANVTGAEFKFITNENKYTLEGNAASSYKFENEPSWGYTYNIGFRKSSGNFQYRISQELFSDTYDPNDMGYLRRNNEILTEGQLQYNLYKPKGFYNEWYNNAWVEYRRIYNPNDVFGTEYGLASYVIFKNYMEGGFFALYRTEQKDYYETRTENRYLLNPDSWIGGINYETDNRKKLNYENEIGFYIHPGVERHGIWMYNEINLRIGQKFEVEYDLNVENNINNVGFVDKNEASDSIFFGRRDVKDLESKLEFKYVFNNKMSLGFRGRHYWSGARYKQYYLLNEDGTLNPNHNYNEDSDINFNAFTIDMTFRWIFAPGSELSVVWKNNIYDEGNYFESRYMKNLNDIFKANQVNSISIKALYYIDVNNFRKNKNSL